MTRFALALGIAILTVAAPLAWAEVPSAVAPGQVGEPQGLYQGVMHGYTPNMVTGGKVVDTRGLAELIKTDKPVLLDVAEADRKPQGMAPGMIWSPTHRTIPGAVFLQGGGSGTDDKAYGDAFAARVKTLTGGDKAKPIVTFCHPDCWGSYNAAKRLIELGYTNVVWFRDGLEGWEAENNDAYARPDATWRSSLPKDLTQ